MFDFVRTHSRLALGVMVLLIFPSFVFFGIQGYSRFTEGGNETVASVDGNAITRAEWDRAHQRNVERLRRQMPNIDAALLDTPQMKRETLDGLLRERVLLSQASKAHLVPDDARLQRLFVTDPQFAQLRNADGTVNRDLLAAQGMSPQMFEQQLRQEFGMQQVLQAVGQSSIAPMAVVGSALDALLQRREVQLQRFDAAQFMGQVTPSDADLEAYYKANEAQFKASEQASIEYVTLTLDALSKGVAVPEEDLRRYYTENASRYTATEERRASHILIKAEPDKKAAKAKAEELLAQVRKAPASFAEVAKKNSQDPGSAAQGGDLDFFGRGMMTKPFEDAVFAMKTGEISNVIESDFGFHIITLTAVKGGDKKPFEAVRAEIEAEVRKSLAQKKYAEAAEQFTNTVYEQPDSLQPVIDKLKLDKQTATVQRTPAPGATGALGSAKLLAAVFSNDVVRNKRNTDAVEIGANQLAAARIVTHTPARTLPLAEVKERVRQRVVASMAAKKAREDGAKRLADLQKTPTETLPVTLTLSRPQSQGLPREIVDAVLRADAGKLPAVIGIDLGEAGYAVARVTQVLPREAVPGGDGPLQQQYGQAWANAEAQAYLAALKKRHKAEVKEAVVAAAAASSATP
ncbi:MAG: SurA N-terminal domain-containing protein [Rubrivivax sp.]